eukprot:sb/3469693/
MGCKKNMIKLLLVVFNVVAVIIGLALIGIGAFTMYRYGDILSITESTFTSIPTVLIILGLMVFILGFLGCFGSFRENRALLIFIKEKVYDALEVKTDEFIKYDITKKEMYKDSAEVVDQIQETLACCGVHGIETYTDNASWNKTHGTHTVPASCCDDVTSGYCNTKNNTVNGEGCNEKVANTLSDNAGLVIGISFGFILIQIIGVCLGCVLCQRIARDGYKEV